MKSWLLGFKWPVSPQAVSCCRGVRAFALQLGLPGPVTKASVLSLTNGGRRLAES